MKPKMSYPLLVGPSDVVIHIAAKLFRSTGVGTKVELAFVDEEDRRIANNQFIPFVSTFIPAFGRDLAVSSGRTTTPLAFAMVVGFKSRFLDKPAALTRTGTAMAAMKTERNEIGCVFMSG
jgi:hypothetical protein